MSSEFKLLVLPFSSRLYRMAYRLLDNREEAEDAVQEVYLKLWRMRDDLKKYKSLEALCVQVTRNHCMDLIRRKKLERAVKEEKQTDKGEPYLNPSEELLRKERSEILSQLINQLPEPRRSLVHFRHIEGKDYKEIEELMDMKENAIRVSISRARKQLKEMLQKQYASWIN